jgi:hypothetical protein
MVDLIQVSISPPEIGYISTQDVYGGKNITITITQEVVDLLAWVKEHKGQVQREAELRKTNPSLNNMWEQYQTMLRIVMDDV